MTQSKVSINDETLNLMEFGKMGIIEGFISENSIDREEFPWSKRFLFGNHLEIS